MHIKKEEQHSDHAFAVILDVALDVIVFIPRIIASTIKAIL